MEIEALAIELRRRDLAILAVCHHPTAPDVLTVYLHGNAGQWVNGMAMMTAADIPGVLSVVASAQTPSILLLRVDKTDRNENLPPGPGYTKSVT